MVIGMRMHTLSIDAFICLFLSLFVALGTGSIAGYIAEKAYEKTLEEHQAVDGEIGGRADETAFRARSIEDLLSHDTFTIVSHGIHYRNEGAGFHGNCYFYNLELPNGERVAARINGESVQFTGDSIYSGDSILPIGRVVWEDLTKDKSFMSQIEFRLPLTRKDFYVDMVGNTAVPDEETALKAPKAVTMMLTVFICFPVFHMMGSKLGIFYPYFSSRKKSANDRRP